MVPTMYQRLKSTAHFRTWCSILLSTDSSLRYHLESAKKNGVTLTDEEEAEVQKKLQEQIDSLYEDYADKVDESITDEAEKRAAEEKLLLEDLKANGLTYDKYIKSIEESLRDQAIGKKYVRKYPIDFQWLGFWKEICRRVDGGSYGERRGCSGLL